MDARHTLPFVLLAVAGCGRPAADRIVTAPGPALIELRLADAAPVAGREPVVSEGRTFFVEARPIVADADLRYVRPYVNKDTLLLELYFTEEGGQRLSRVTGDNVGRFVAFVVNSAVRSVSVIASALVNADVRVQAMVALSADEASRVASMIRTRWPDSP